MIKSINISLVPKEEIKHEEPLQNEFLVKIDPIGESKLTDEQKIKNFQTKIGIERHYILFGEAPISGEQLSTELIIKQKNIRNKLKMNEGASIEFSLEKAFKIIDALNMQTLFVYDPNFEKYCIDNGKKCSTTQSGSRIFSYFPNDDRECSVCAEDYKIDDILMKLSACGHVFHADCCENYIYYSSNCPLCRQDIYQE